MLAPVLVAKATDMPVTLAEAKSQLRVVSTTDDALINRLIAAATRNLDGWGGILGRAIVRQTWRQDLAGFNGCMRLMVGPVSSINSITYFDESNVQQTLPVSCYALFNDMLGPYVGLKVDQFWPESYSRPDAVSIEYFAGSEVADVDEDIKHAICLMVGHFYENREAVAVGVSVAELPLAVEWLIAPHRRVM